MNGNWGMDELVVVLVAFIGGVLVGNMIQLIPLPNVDETRSY
jgi:hypothetical protein